jgi:hypothetical protein
MHRDSLFYSLSGSFVRSLEYCVLECLMLSSLETSIGNWHLIVSVLSGEYCTIVALKWLPTSKCPDSHSYFRILQTYTMRTVHFSLSSEFIEFIHQNTYIGTSKYLFTVFPSSNQSRVKKKTDWLVYTVFIYVFVWRGLLLGSTLNKRHSWEIQPTLELVE